MCKYCKEQKLGEENYIGVFDSEYRKMNIEIYKSSLSFMIRDCENGNLAKRKDYVIDINYCPMCGKKLGE